MKIAIFGRKVEKSSHNVFSILFDTFISNNITFSIYEPFANELLKNEISLPANIHFFNNHQELSNDYHFLFSLGGDGTLLESIRYVRNYNIPIVGINTGRLGFLANIAANEISISILELLKGNFTLENRSLLMFDCCNNPFFNFPYALNEITIQKHDASLITIEVCIDNEDLNRYWADGLIVSTPTGSTAYSLSVGGPIVAPDCKAFIISPIASHNLTVRPLIIPDNKKIKLRAFSRSKKFLVTLDSKTEIFNSDSELAIQLANFNIQLVQLPNHSFFHTIRKKLMWGADVRN